MNKKVIHTISSILGLVLFALAAYALYHTLHKYTYRELVRNLTEIPPRQLLLSLGLAVSSYFLLTWYDVLALRYLGRKLEYHKTAVASFLGYVFSHNVGLSVLGAGAARYRVYSVWGVSALETGKIVVFAGLTFWLGYFFVGGLVFLAEPLPIPDDIKRLIKLPVDHAGWLGWVFLAVAAAYVTAIVLRRRPLRLKGWDFHIPSLRITLVQLLLSSADWFLFGSVLYALLPPIEGLTFLKFMPIFLLAESAALASHIPGGIGVLDFVTLFLVKPYLPDDSLVPRILAALLAFRAIYYILPLGLGTGILGVNELLQRKELMRRTGAALNKWVPLVAPNLLAVITFVAGAMLLFAGSTPSHGHDRLPWLRRLVEDFSLREISHLLGGVVGAGLLLLGRGLQRRLDAAWHLALGFLGAGIVLAVVRDFDVREAAVLTIILGVLLPCRSYFYRHSSLVSERFSMEWVGALAVVLISAVWLGFFSHRHHEFADLNWWQFLRGQSPTWMRATAAAMAVILLFAVARLLRPARPKVLPPSASESERVLAILAGSERTYANLALLGDKSFLLSPSGRSFIMYAVEGRSWVALGEPVGPAGEKPDLAYRFTSMADRHSGWASFYGVRAESVNLYIELGLTPLRMGDEARIRLGDFGEGGRQAQPLAAHNRQTGLSFQVLPAGQVADVLPQLREVSDSFLSAENVRERGFALGFFREEYIRHFPAALVLREGRIIAFADLWPGAGKEELAVDLLRHRPEAPEEVLDYLLVELAAWARAEGYSWLNLGMAPTPTEEAGTEPLWSRKGAFVFRHGEHFDDLASLRQFKQRYDPEWQERFLVSPGGLALPQIYTNIAALVTRGPSGVM